MQNELDSRFILGVFEKIRQHGEAQDNGYFLDGVKAYTDMDGYTVFLEDAKVSLRFGFHNQYHYDYQHADHLEQFEKKLHAIDKQY
ncbi:DUF3081 domain-containing protein [Aestuariibacter halophilus]|uniref:DUF3081 domain-containing protein n=1 Tax=Fluctibacter halophilus TaxID=226011 RepID=A0ABS8G2N1_9ALTE|nr:DUF3081 domain-containing protein [Aestuariibacter halophilus]MCC2614688.1 DUF3081 domain-containing protein [Aestuariibacter halophilus]